MQFYSVPLARCHLPSTQGLRVAGGSLIGHLTKIARDLLLFCAMKQVLVETISLRLPSIPPVPH